MRRTWFHSVVAVLVAGQIVVGGCRSPNPTTPVGPTKPIDTVATIATDGARPQVALESSETGKIAMSFLPSKPAEAAGPIQNLPQARVEELLARVEPLPDLSTKPAPIVRPPTTAPAGRATTPIAFAAPTGKQVADSPAGQLKMQASPLLEPDIYPDGEIDGDSTVRIRFDEPMVPIASVGANATNVPATITPAVAGTWRWLDTRVAEFTVASKRFAMATEFTVTIAAGVRAESGATLPKTVTSTFMTRGPKIENEMPHYIRATDPIAFEFDQDVDAAAIAKFLTIGTKPRDANDKTKWTKQEFTITTLDAAKAAWATNPVARKTEIKFPTRTIVIAPKTAWPFAVDANATLHLGAPSKEGPLTTRKESATSFRVAEKFEILGIVCGEGDKIKPKFDPICPASERVDVKFSSQVNRTSFKPEWVQIVGAEPRVHDNVYDTLHFYITGAVGKKYTIHVEPNGIVDDFGQALTNAKDLTFTSSKALPPRYPPMIYPAFGQYGSWNMFILDPRFQVPQWVVDTSSVEGLHIELYRVDPSDWFAYTEFDRGKRELPPGKKLFDKVYPVGKLYGGHLRQDLRPALDAKTGTGQIIAIASPSPPIVTKVKNEHRRHAWIQVTKLGMTVRYDGDNVHAWVDSIAPDTTYLHPIASASTSLIVKGRTDVPAPIATDADGHAAFPLLDAKKRTGKVDPYDDGTWENRYYRNHDDAVIVARSGSDSVFATMPETVKTKHHDFARWYVTDDRFTYRPGEQLFVKGWLRWTTDGLDPQIHTKPGTVAWSLSDRRGTKLASGTSTLTDQGGFDLETTIPDTAMLGYATLSFETPIPGTPTEKDSYSHSISIQEFRTPAFALALNDDVTHAGATPLYVGESIQMSATASYFGGGGLGGAKIEWDADLEPARFRPPNLDAYTFDPRTAYNRDVEAEETDVKPFAIGQESKLDGEATSNAVFAISSLPGKGPAILDVHAAVTDLDRQTIGASSRKILVHSSSYYVGMRNHHSRTVMGGDLEFVVADVDGKLVPGVAIEVSIDGKSRADTTKLDHQTCKLTSAATPVRCSYTRKDHTYEYVGTAKIADARGRKSATGMVVPWWSADDGDFEVTADKELYRVGDVAKITVRSKRVPAAIVVSFARQGVIAQKRISLVEPTTVVELPITESYLENVHILVDRWTTRVKDDDDKNTGPLPEHDQTEIDLAVDIDSVRIDVATRPLERVVEPGANATFEVIAKKDGKPVANAEIALIVVDEAILSLSSRTHEDPLGAFFENVEHRTEGFATFELVTDAGSDLPGAPGWERYLLSEHGSGTGSGYGVGGGRGGMKGRTSAVPSVSVGAIKTRKDFRPTAVFAPRLRTDANGKVTASVKMPDSLTRFRIVALASATERWFGKGENTIVTQLPINARTQAPRFLTQGDSFGLPVIVQNLDRKPRTIDVAVRASNLASTGVAGKRVVVPPGQRAEVRFDFATVARGAAAIQTVVASDSTNAVDANIIVIPVYEPATTESFATFGIVDDKPQFEQLVVPAEIYPEIGGVEAEVSSTQLQSLTDAYWYLHAYPYECAEQRSGRMLATAAMYDVLDAFAAPGKPTKPEIEAQRGRDLAKLSKDQNGDGGWNFYPRMKSDPFITQQVLAAFAAAKDTGDATKKATMYVTNDANTRLARLEAAAKLPTGERKDREKFPYDVGVIAADLGALAVAGVDVKPRAQRLHVAATALDAYPIDAKARVLALVAKQVKFSATRDKLLAALLGQVRETAAGAVINVKFLEGERLLFGSNMRTSALVLDALLREAPAHAVIPKLVRGILAERKRGRWGSTQENLAVLSSMRRYFDIFEKTPPSYTGKLWFGEAAYAEESFQGHTTKRARVAIDWTTLGLGKSYGVALDKTGTGRMYYRVGITYAPKLANPPPLDAGFVVRRSYTPLDDPKDVTIDGKGIYHVKLGARVQVRLEMINTARRNTVGFSDPMPAGFEAINPELANSERISAAVSAQSGWDYTILRDERAEGFASSLAEGSHFYQYAVRATTPGTFVVAPTKAEEMYEPETFGRSSGVTVVIQ